MKKALSILFLLLFGIALNTSAQTADKAAQRVAALSDAVKALGNYAVRFTIEIGEHKVAGHYTVGSDCYALTLGAVEVYGDTKCRYEVDTSRREVVIDSVDTTSHNLLNNPLSAFNFIGEEYRSEMLSEGDGVAVLKLTPRQKGEQEGVMEVTIDSRTNLPKRVVYQPSGESIRVNIDYIGATTVLPTKFDQAKYRDFEIIDFR